MFKNMIGRKNESAAQTAQETAAAPAAEEKKKASTVQVTVRLRPEQHKQLKAAAFHRDCDMSEHRPSVPAWSRGSRCLR